MIDCKRSFQINARDICETLDFVDATRRLLTPGVYTDLAFNREDTVAIVLEGLYPKRNETKRAKPPKQNRRKNLIILTTSKGIRPRSIIHSRHNLKQILCCHLQAVFLVFHRSNYSRILEEFSRKSEAHKHTPFR